MTMATLTPLATSCTGADSNVSVDRSPVAGANVIPRRCALARLVLHLQLTISILSLGSFMTSFSGCVLPVGPRFEDPPAVEDVPPIIKSTMPPQGSTVTAVNNAQTFSVTFTDINARTDLYVRWVGEYPSYNPSSHPLHDDQTVTAPVNGQPVDTTSPITVTCFDALARTGSHTITVFISDSPFWNPSEPMAPTDLEQLLTKNKAKTLLAQANWVLNLNCQ
jgi:hypothetical protein